MTTSTNTTPPTTATRRRRRVDPRTVALAVAVIAFVIGLLVVSDYLSRVGAQSLIARAVQHETGSPDRPHVDLHGLFFLPQVVDGVYGNVEIDVADVHRGPVNIAEIDAHLYNVHVPFHDVLTRQVHRIVVERTDEVARLRYADLNAYLRAQQIPLTIGPAGHGSVKFTGTVQVLGADVSASADAKVAARGHTLYITPVQFDTGLGAIDQASRLLLAQRFTVTVPLRSLPFGQTITGAQATASGVTVRAKGTDVVLGH